MSVILGNGYLTMKTTPQIFSKLSYEFTCLKEQNTMELHQQLDRKEMRELALQAAIKLIAQRGLHGLSFRKIASTMGCKMDDLYPIFENLDDLILQVNTRTLDELYTLISETEQDSSEPEACLLGFGYTYLQFAIEQPLRWNAIFEHRLTRGAKVPNWYQNKILRLFSLVEKPLRESMPTLEPNVCAQATRALWGSVHGICVLALTKKFDVVGTESAQELMRLLMISFLTGLKTQYLIKQYVDLF